MNIPTAMTTLKDIKTVKILRSLFKKIRLFFLKIEIEKIKDFEQEILEFEWKKLALQFDYIFFVVSILTVILTPIFLFGKFFLRDFITYEYLKSPCGCTNTFVKIF